MVVAFEKETPIYAEPGAGVRAQNNEHFGIYRPLTMESAAEVIGVLSSAEPAVENFLSRNRGIATADIVSRGSFGVTFIGSHLVRSALMSPKFNGGFGEYDAVQKVSEYVEERPKLSIPVSKFDWIDNQNRLLAIVFEPPQELTEEAATMQFFINRAGGGKRVHLKKPNHITLFKYGWPGDRRGLKQQQRKRAANIMAQHFRKQGVHSVELDKPVVGNGYDHPWHADMLVAS